MYMYFLSLVEVIEDLAAGRLAISSHELDFKSYFSHLSISSSLDSPPKHTQYHGIFNYMSDSR